MGFLIMNDAAVMINLLKDNRESQIRREHFPPIDKFR